MAAATTELLPANIWRAAALFARPRKHPPAPVAILAPFHLLRVQCSGGNAHPPSLTNWAEITVQHGGGLTVSLTTI